MKDRVRLGNKKDKMSRFLLPKGSGTTLSELLTLLQSGVYHDTDNNNATGGDNAGVVEIGNPLSKGNLLADTTAAALGMAGSPEPTVDLAFNQIINNQKWQKVVYDKLGQMLVSTTKIYTLPKSVYDCEAIFVTVSGSDMSTTANNYSKYIKLGVAPYATPLAVVAGNTAAMSIQLNAFLYKPYEADFCFDRAPTSHFAFSIGTANSGTIQPFLSLGNSVGRLPNSDKISIDFGCSGGQYYFDAGTELAIYIKG